MEYTFGRKVGTVQQECCDFIPQLQRYLEEGLPDDVARHVENCPACGAHVDVHGSTVEELRAIWRAKEPERKAWELFQKDCTDWYETWQGKIYLYFGGPSWSRRAKWLGIPRWKNYKPVTNELSKPAC